MITWHLGSLGEIWGVRSFFGFCLKWHGPMSVRWRLRVRPVGKISIIFTYMFLKVWSVESIITQPSSAYVFVLWSLKLNFDS